MSLKLTKRHSSPNWYLRGTVLGITVDESCRTNDKKAAEIVRARREAEIMKDQLNGPQQKYTFLQAVVSYLEGGGEKRFITKLLSHFGELPLIKMDQRSVDQAASLLYSGCANSTLNRQLYTPISAILRHAHRAGMCGPISLKRRRQKPTQIKWLKIEEADRLINCAAPHLQPLLIFLFYTGARIGEALWLQWKSVDLNRAHVTFENTKNGSARGVPLHPRVLSALEALPRREGEVFRTPSGNAYQRLTDRDDTSAGTRIATAFKSACKHAGIMGFTPHDCRHTWATWHYIENRNIVALQRLGGWNSVQMVMRYTHVNVDELAETIKRLPGEYAGKTMQKR